MKKRCVDAINAAAGRSLSAAELDKIEGAFNKSAMRLARSDPQRWHGLSTDQKTIEAGVQSVADLQAAAALKKKRAVLQIIKTADTDNRVADQVGIFKSTQAEGLVREMQHTQNYINGIKNRAVARLFDTIEAVKSTEGLSARERVAMFLFDTGNPKMERDVSLEVFAQGNGGTGNPMAVKAAKGWLDTIEPLRTRMNGAGGDVGKLDYGYLPHGWDSGRVLRGYDAFAEFTLPHVDRKRYVNADGTPMSDEQVLDFLRNAAESIGTDGQNKRPPGAFQGAGERANAGSETREIHFKDGESYLAVMAQYGRGSMYDAMIGHIGKMSRDIGLVERYGPDSAAQMRLQIDLAERADGGEKRVFANLPEGYWNVLSGASGVPRNVLIARLGEVGRAIQTGGKLAGAMLSSLGDMGTLVLTTGYNGLPYWQTVGNIGRAATKETKDWMLMHGIISESITSDMHRFAGEHFASGTVSRLASATLKLSGLNFWTDTGRNALQLSMMAGLGRMSRTDWGALHGFDRDLMASRGITPADWAVMRSATLESHKGIEFLTPQAIEATGHPDASSVVAKVLGLTRDEGEFGVINPDLATKTVVTFGGQQAGTGIGELARAVMQFKTFPIAMISRHYRRMLDTAKLSSEGRPLAANPLMYGAMFGASLLGLGAIQLQAKQIAAGKDTIDMFGPHAAKFWTQAVVQGGGLSLMGEVILGDSGIDTAKSLGKMLLGPMLGTAIDVGGIIKDNAKRRFEHRPTHAAAELVRVARSNLPFVNLWYAKAAVDHAAMNALQENLSPGYLDRQRQRAAREWGQDYWWKPGTGLPQRLPR